MSFSWSLSLLRALQKTFLSCSSGPCDGDWNDSLKTFFLLPWRLIVFAGVDWKTVSKKGDLTGAPPVASIDSLASMKVLSAIVEIWLLLKKFQCPCHGSNHILSWKALWYWRSIVVDMIHRDELDKTPWVAKDGAFTANRELVGVLLRWASTSA